jgi:two-component system phosphate regulon response regulator PhoB
MRLPPEILLIEDDPDDRDLFAKAIAASGLDVRVTYTTSAPEAVMRLNQMGGFAKTPLPALIVLDLSLDGLQGQTLLQVIRNAYGPRDVPIVILTGSLRDRDRTDCERWGISDFVVKPRSHYGLTKFVLSLTRFLPEGEDFAGAEAPVANAQLPPGKS